MPRRSASSTHSGMFFGAGAIGSIRAIGVSRSYTITVSPLRTRARYSESRSRNSEILAFFMTPL